MADLLRDSDCNGLHRLSSEFVAVRTPFRLSIDFQGGQSISRPGLLDYMLPGTKRLYFSAFGINFFLRALSYLHSYCNCTVVLYFILFYSGECVMSFCWKLL